MCAKEFQKVKNKRHCKMLFFLCINIMIFLFIVIIFCVKIKSSITPEEPQMIPRGDELSGSYILSQLERVPHSERACTLA